jgi:chemotaxis protein MotB
MVPASKYNKLKGEHDRLTQLLSEKDSELLAAQDSFRKRFEDVSREIDLYKEQASDSKDAAEAARKELDAYRAGAKKREDELRAIGVGSVRDGRLVLQASLLFALGSDQLSQQGQRALDKVAAAFRGKDVLIQVDGHTDTTPIVKDATRKAHVDNMGLSAHRALAVYRHLAQKGIPRRNLYIRAFGPYWPVASNLTAASKANNRRVEILFIPASMVPRPSSK